MICSNLPNDRDYPIIDSHCHIFNASDLSISGFLRQVILDTDEGGLIEVLDPLVAFLSSLVRGAPSGEDEQRWLDDNVNMRNFPFFTPRLMSLDIARDLDVEEGETVEFATEVQNAVKRLTLSTDPGDRLLLKKILTENEVENSQLNLLTLESTGISPLAFPLFQGVGAVGRLVRWVRLLKSYRWKILAKLMKNYGEAHGCIELFTPALVDYEYWLNDPPRTRFPSQYELMSRISRLVAPRMHPLAAFDPWRESLAPGGDDGSLAWVQRAVVEWGFIGVKIYPPMGFAPLGNEELDFTAIGQSNSQEFGARLDDAMRSLFSWAVDMQVPIMAHASDSNENKEGYGERAGPKFWRQALNVFPKLTVNIAHFGGHGMLDQPNGWPAQFIKLMNDFDNVYADLGHFDQILVDSESDGLLESLATLIKNNPILKDRLMYGSDWSMIARAENANLYFERMLGGLSSRLDSETVAKIFGINAANFFGLRGKGKNTNRLKSFYGRHSIPYPKWL